LHGAQIRDDRLNRVCVILRASVYRVAHFTVSETSRVAEGRLWALAVSPRIERKRARYL